MICLIHAFALQSYKKNITRNPFLILICTTVMDYQKGGVNQQVQDGCKFINNV